MTKYEPRDLEGSVNVFWNHAILGTSGVQPGGQVIAGIGVEVLNLEKSRRKGNRSRYCGRPGKMAIRKSTSNTVFSVLPCESEFVGIFG